VWTAVVNTVGPTAPGANGVSDLALVIVVLGAAAFAAAVGLFRFARLGGLAFLTIAGGGSVGVRVVVLRAGLLLPSIGFDWALVAACAVGGFAMLLKQRLAVVRCTVFSLVARTLMERCRSPLPPPAARSFSGSPSTLC
jgi:hypothetical protein